MTVARRSAENTQAVLLAGGREAVQDALAKHPKAEGLQQHGACVLSNLLARNRASPHTHIRARHPPDKACRAAT